MRQHEYYVYILTNKNKNVLYVGMTNHLYRRLIEHYANRGNLQTFTGKYQCHCLVYYEMHQQVSNAIRREKEIKGWSRSKKLFLIKTLNPNLIFLDSDIVGCWPPLEEEVP